MLTCSKVKVGPLLRKDLPDDIVARRGRLRWIISDAQVDIDSSMALNEVLQSQRCQSLQHESENNT